MFKILLQKNYNTHDIAILRMNASYVHATKYSSKLRLVKGLYHCHFRLSFLINSSCSRHNWLMLTKICRKVLSYTVILICMSFIFSKQLNFVCSGYFFHIYKNVLTTLLHNQINEKLKFFFICYTII